VRTIGVQLTWFVVLIALCATIGESQVIVPPSTPYGVPLTLAQAEKATSSAKAEALRNKVAMVVAIVDPSGLLVNLEKMDGAQNGSIEVAIDKARSAALFKRPTKVFMDAVTQGGDGVRFLALRGAVPIEGGIPLIVNGKIIGAIGVSGGAGTQDGDCARSGAESLSMP